MKENKLLQNLYIVFLGILIAVFVGVGINTFYESPKYPMSTAQYMTKQENLALDEEARVQEMQESEAYQKKRITYERNVSIILISFAVLLVAGSIALENKETILGNGIMLGGLFTLIHSIIRASESNNSKYMFATTTIGLAIVVYIGYRYFSVKKTQETSRKKLK